MARYIIYGAGGVGCLIGGRLHLAGHDVVLIARGDHGKMMAEQGLTLRSLRGESVLRLPVVTTVAELVLKGNDIVVLAMKSQDSAEALERLASHAPPETTIVCAQNGVASEGLALRMFDHVYGALVVVYAAIIAPGTVTFYTQDCAGVVDVGRYPDGLGDRSAGVADDLADAGFRSLARPDIMRWKRGKLLISLGNVVGALCPPDDRLADLLARARDEAERCFDAAGLDHVPLAEMMNGPFASLPLVPVDGDPFPGGSTLQGMARGSRTSEADYFNGEVARLGRLFGLPTPVNSFLQEFMRDSLARNVEPGSLSPRGLLDAFARWGAKAVSRR